MSDSLELLLSYIKDHMKQTAALLNSQPVMTDGETDITQSLRGRLEAYANIKFFIDNGMRDV
tara:strand:+ start:482 stop:667 length:186 start_codon:yes stop_codon:yes gene_type:complete